MPAIEMLITSSSKSRKFRSFMVRLAKEFKRDDLSELKYALRETIPAGKMESLDKPLDIFTELEERGVVGPGKLDKLRCLMEDIDRPFLISMVDEFDDSGSAFPLKAKSQNYLEMDGYRLAVKGGRHFETTEGEFVEVKSGSNYALTITNSSSQRCIAKMNIDGYEMFPGGFLVNPKQEWTIERPSREEKKFKFFAIADAPEGSGINKWRSDLNGLVKVVFTPERADMKVVCVAKGATAQALQCSYETTDSEFYEMVSASFGTDNATIMVNGWKPLGKRDVKLTEYGIRDGSQVEVNLGGRGGVSLGALPSIEKKVASKKAAKWRAGATTLQDESKQKFGTACRFPLDLMRVVSLHLRLVVREDEIGLPSAGKCTPLAKATLIPPPVPS